MGEIHKDSNLNQRLSCCKAVLLISTPSCIRISNVQLQSKVLTPNVFVEHYLFGGVRFLFKKKKLNEVIETFNKFQILFFINIPSLCSASLGYKFLLQAILS